MRKLNFIALAIFTSSMLFAQVGIGTDEPRGALDVNNQDGTNTAGIVLPRISDMASVVSPVTGTIVYDLVDKCVKVFTTISNEDKWSGCLAGGPSDPGEDPGYEPGPGGGFGTIEGECSGRFVVKPNFIDDPITRFLTTSLDKYTAAPNGAPVFITKEEYDNMRSISRLVGEDISNIGPSKGEAGRTEYTRQNRTSEPGRYNFFAFAVNASANQYVSFKIFTRAGYVNAHAFTYSSKSLPPVKLPNEGENYLVFKHSAIAIQMPDYESLGANEVFIGIYAEGRVNMITANNRIGTWNGNLDCKQVSDLNNPVPARSGNRPAISALAYVQ